jgi:F-type H+-transporting ATPase subunit delta
MSDRVDAYANAIHEVARTEGSLDEVVDELFRFARTMQANDELRAVLTDAAIPVQRRIGVVQDLLGERASPITANLVMFVVGAGRARELPVIVDRVVERAAAEKQRVVAEVRSAIPLDDQQVQRLADALSSATGNAVEVRVIVDPSIIGGIVAEIGDTVIDGSVRSRLDRLREQIK